MVTGFHGQMVKWQKKGFPYCCQVVKERLYECQLWFRLLYWLDFLDAYDTLAAKMFGLTGHFTKKNGPSRSGGVTSMMMPCPCSSSSR